MKFRSKIKANAYSVTFLAEFVSEGHGMRVDCELYDIAGI